MRTGSFYVSNDIDFHGISIMFGPYNKDYIPELTSLAADGLLATANPSVQKEMKDARLFEKLLREKADCKDWKTVGEICVRIYTCGSFVFKLANKFLYDSDFSTANKAIGILLAPYISLLHYYLQHAECSTDLTLYRGCNMDLRTIAEYRAHIGMEISWESFTSTSRSFQVARMFTQNVVFRIRAFSGVSIASLSQFPDEEEVLLPIHCFFTVDGVSFDDKEKVYMIDVHLCGNKNVNLAEVERRVAELAMSDLDHITPDEMEERLAMLFSGL